MDAPALVLSCPAVGAEAVPPLPAVIQAGFKSWEKNGSSFAFDVWKKGGLLEDDSKPAIIARYFNRMDRTLGNYKSYELIETKAIGGSSRIIYLSIHFQRAAIYTRFLLYRTDKDWLVENMDFSLKPEVVMPWLAFTGMNYGE